MKQTTCCLLIIALNSFTALHAQEFYLKEGLGYAFAAPGQKVDQSGNILNGTVNHSGQGVIIYDLKNASYSSGPLNVAGAGFMFSRNIGVELDASVNLAP